MDETYDEKEDKNFVLNLINTNARSLCPKFESLITCFDELDAAFGVVTETWFASSAGLQDDLEDIRGRTNIGVLSKPAPKPPGR